jgi:hypothetical protein
VGSDALTIKSPSVSLALSKDGFATVPLIDEETVKSLNSLFLQYCGRLEAPQIFNSLVNCPPETKLKIHREIIKLISPSLNTYFSNYKIAVAIFFVVRPSSSFSEKVGIHQDPTLLMDEGKNLNLKIWCPLMDTDEQSGCMQVLRGSHKFFPPVQAVTISPPYKLLGDINHLFECKPVRTGEAMIFDNRLIHASMPNFSSKTRIAVVMSVVPANAQCISLFRQQGVKKPLIEVYFQDEEWHFHPLWDNTFKPPQVGRKQGYLDYDEFYVNLEEILDLIKTPRPYRQYNYKINSKNKLDFLSLRELFSAT